MSVGTTLVVGFDGKAVKRGLAGLTDSFKGLGNAAAGLTKFAAGVGAIAVGGAVAVAGAPRSGPSCFGGHWQRAVYCFSCHASG